MIKSPHRDGRDLAILKEYVKDLVDPTTLMVALGFSIYKDNDLEVRAPCILHNGDNKTAFQLKKSSKRFKCYTHRCECGVDGNPDNDVIALVRKAKGCSFEEAVQFLASLCGISCDGEGLEISSKEIDALLSKKDMSAFVSMQDYLEGNSEVVSTDLILEAHSKGSKYFSRRGVPENIIKDYTLGTYVDPLGETRAMVPIRDDFGNFVAFSGRSILNENTAEKKYDIKPSGFKKSLVLYNLDRARFEPKSKEFIIIVEGFIAVWHMIECGFKNVVAVMGSALSEPQGLLLLKYGLLNAVLFLDWDESGIDGTKRSISVLKNYGMKFKSIVPMSDYFDGATQPDHLMCQQVHELMSLYI